MNQKEMSKMINYIMLIYLLFNFYVKCDEICNIYRKESDGSKECLDYCPSYKTPQTDGTECIDSLEECRSRGLVYYNREEFMCYGTLPTGDNYYSNEEGTDTLPREDEGGNTYTRSCKSSYFPKQAYNKKVCQRECNNNEFFRPNEPNKCLNRCEDTEYIGSNHECLTECPYFYIEEDNSNNNSNKKCVVNCKEYGKFFFKGDKKCYDSCEKENNNQYFYNSDNNECLDTCKNTDKKYALKNGSWPKQCKSLPSNTFYDEDYFILDSCEEPFHYKTSTWKCISFCINDNYTSNNNKCVTCANKYTYDSNDDKVYCSDNEDCQAIPNLRNAYQEECLESCPVNYILDSENHCSIIKCPDGKGQQGDSCVKCPNFYNVDNQDIVTCQEEECTTFIKDEIDKECVVICPEYNNFIVTDKNCGKFCDPDKYIKKANTQPNENNYKIYECTEDCNFYVKENNEVKEYCFEECPSKFEYKLGSDKYCLQECPTGNKYFDINGKGDNSYYTCTNTNYCIPDNKIYCDGQCYSEDVCLSNGIYYIDDYNCVDNCPLFYKKSINGVIECKSSCTQEEFINGNGLECLEKCPPELNYIGSNNKCRNGCKSENGDDTYYEIEEENVNNIYTIYKCVSQCQHFTRAHDNFCYSSCPSETYTLDNICYDNCFLSPNKYSLRTNTESTCLQSCFEKDMYYYETEKVCLSQCNEDDYAVENTKRCVRDCNSLAGQYYFFEDSTTNVEGQKKFCVQSCPPSKPYLYENTCVESCAFPGSEKRYILKEGDNSKICFTDCAAPYIYYKKKINTINQEEYYECSRNYKEDGYQYYGPNSNPNKVGKISLQSCNHDDQIYKYKNNDECYEKCPSESPFYILNNEDNNCYTNCPNSHPFHEKDADLNYFICKTLNECINDFVDIEEKLCLRKDEKCPDSKKIGRYNEKFVCLNTCGDSAYGQYLTEYNTCVNSCEEYSLEDSLLNYKLEGQNCICENLFYKSENEKTCFANSNGKNCKDMESIYKISIYEENECVSVCDNNRILSLNEEVCYKPSDSFDCSSLDPNTKLIERTDGILKCDCTNKFYLNENNIKTCFSGECEDGYNVKYVPEIKRCMKNDENCPDDFNHIFLDKFCLRQCPSGSSESVSGSEVNCKCEGQKPFWRVISESNYECLVRCFDIHPVYIASTKQCVEKCPDEFPIFYDFKCFDSCNNNEDLHIKNGIEVALEDNDFSQKTCDCQEGDSWFNEDNIKTCVSSCFEGSPSFNYMVFSTKECVNECPIDYHYFFNDYCYSSCDIDPLLKSNEPYRECLCKFGWYYYTDNGRTKKKCLNIDQTCISANIGKNYLIDRTKECVQECPQYLYEFNNVCYDVCPEKTIDNINENGNFCSCNLNDGYWYEYKESGLTFKECGLKECPEYDKDDGTKERMNLIESEKKCVKSCRTDGGEENQNYYAFKKICLKDCPILTKTNEDDDECSFYNLTLDENFINDKDKFKDAASIQINELYAKYETSYNKYGFSLEIYPIDDKSKRDIALNSNKTYIDFISCLERIYLDKNISDPEKILIAKYDLLPGANINIDKGNDKYLINPVEYELFSSSDTNERLDALVCEPNEILVSYPLCIDKFDQKEGDVNQNEFRQKFDLGKKLHEEDNSIDTFNFNNTIYKTFCRGLEIDGKDLVFEDRYKYLYPYNKILCESNCTLKNTDFELERVNCLCEYKGDFDFYRREDETNDIFNDKNYFIPSQSGANAEVIKCLFNFTFSQATLKNEAFYCCFLVTAVEVVLLFVNAAYGIKGVSDNIKKSLNKLNDVFRKNRNNHSKNINIITTSNKPLNHPPKKNNYEDEKDAHTDNDKITSESFDDKSGNSESDEFKYEYIPSEYCSKFFKQSDMGVFKKIDRNKIPFGVSPDTKYLIDKINGGEKENNYLIITDDNTNNSDINKMIKYIKEEKMNKDVINKFEQKTKKRVNLFENSKNNENLKKLNGNNLIKVKAINPVTSQEYTEDMTIGDLEEENDMDVDTGNASCITLIRREQLFLRIDYGKYISKKHPSNSYIFFAEIFDKIYLIKIILFLGKYDIFCIQLSLYIFCHLLLFSLLCGFFTVNVIRKIWEQNNFPNVNFYLLYGLISHIIIWVIYKIFLYLLDCSDKIRELLLIKRSLKEEDYIEDFNDNSDEKNQNIINKKYKEQASEMRFRIFLFYVIMFIIIVFCTIYLISFFSIYTGTKKKVFIAYLVSLLEIVFIKALYGICLASLRLASKVNKLRSLYDLVYVFDKFIS